MATLNLMKLTGLGNDFLVCEADHASRSDWDALARRVCDRTSGPGADLLVCLTDELARTWGQQEQATPGSAEVVPQAVLMPPVVFTTCSCCRPVRGVAMLK